MLLYFNILIAFNILINPLSKDLDYLNDQINFEWSRWVNLIKHLILTHIYSFKNYAFINIFILNIVLYYLQ